MFFKIGVEFKDNDYHIMWLNPNAVKKELFIHFIVKLPSGLSKLPVNKDGMIINEIAHFDHLSFHSDGKVHIKHKSKKKSDKYSHEVQNINLYDYPEDKVVPLICNSYFHVGSNEYFKLNKEEDNLIKFNVLNKPFTMMVFLVSKKSGNAFLQEYIAHKFTIIDEPVFLDMDDDKHLILVLVVSELPVELKNGYLKKQLELSNVSRKSDSLMVSYGFLPPLSYLEKGLFKPDEDTINLFEDSVIEGTDNN